MVRRGLFAAPPLLWLGLEGRPCRSFAVREPGKRLPRPCACSAVVLGKGTDRQQRCHRPILALAGQQSPGHCEHSVPVSSAAGLATRCSAVLVSGWRGSAAAYKTACVLSGSLSLVRGRAKLK